MVDPVPSPWLIYLLAALGVAVSVVLPIVRAYLPKPPATLRRRGLQPLSPYLATGVFSLIVAGMIVLWYGAENLDPRTAFFAGYAIDATLQKMGTGNVPVGERPGGL